MSKNRKKGDLWVRNFKVTHNCSTPVTFEVTSILYPEGFPEVSTTLKVTKKFSEFQKLHKSLQSLHKGLYLKGTFPKLPKGKYFEKPDEPVIEERRAKCLELLEFVGTQPQLFNSSIFTEFFAHSLEDQEQERQSEEECSDDSPVKETVIEMHRSGNVMDASLLSVQLGRDQTPTLRPQTPTTPEEEMKHLPLYLSQAAKDVSKAIQYELDEEFEESVDCYRNAISILLSSVQQDKCLKRQASVKRRIAQYISKAEDLVLKSNKSPQLRKKSVVPHAGLMGNLSDLKKYKVIDVISQKVLLAQDFHNPENLVIMKVVVKSSEVVKVAKRSLLPLSIPHMVKLLCYYESEFSLFLVLEFVPNGQLYFGVRNIFKRNFSSNDPLLNPSSVPSPEFNANTSIIKPSASFLGQTPSPAEDLDIVHKISNEDGKTENLLCINQNVVEKIDLSDSSSSEDFDFIDDCVQEATEALDQGQSSSNRVIEDSKALIENLNKKLKDENSSEKVEAIMKELETLETSMFYHNRRRSYTPGGMLSPYIHPRPSSAESGGWSAPSSSPVKEQQDFEKLKPLPVFSGYSFQPLEPLPIALVKRWAVQLFTAIFQLHSLGVLVKDLNPNNILLDEKGDLKLTFQYEWVSIDKTLDPQAEQCWYTSPEAIDIQPLTIQCDYWSVGVILYEISTGYAFVDVYPSGLRMHTPLEFFNAKVDPDLASLIQELVHPISSMRLAEEDVIKQHPFFKDVSWSIWQT